MFYNQHPQDGPDEHKGSRPRAPRPYQALLRACSSSSHQVNLYYEKKLFGAEILLANLFLVHSSSCHQVEANLQFKKLLRYYFPMTNLVHTSY